MASKTNAVRLIQQARIPCRECFYKYDEQDLCGMHAAKAIGFPPEQVFKTLVTRGSRSGIYIFCIPVCFELDLKKAACVTGEKSISLINVNELPTLTGYIRGGCSPVGMKRHYPTYIDEICQLFDEIAISAGERGHQMIVPPLQFANYIEAELADIII